MPENTCIMKKYYGQKVKLWYPLLTNRRMSLENYRLLFLESVLRSEILKQILCASRKSARKFLYDKLSRAVSS